MAPLALPDFIAVLGAHLLYSMLGAQKVRLFSSGKPIVKVGCGAEFSMILDCHGGLYSFGLPEYGQLGKYQQVRILFNSSLM